MSRRRGLQGIGNVARGLIDFLEDLTAKTPDQSEAIAEGVLALRDQGLARYVTDDMMAKADDRYMFANTPLPMDEASRMERASEMGFDPRTFYHGTRYAVILMILLIFQIMLVSQPSITKQVREQFLLLIIQPSQIPILAIMKAAYFL